MPFARLWVRQAALWCGRRGAGRGLPSRWPWERPGLIFLRRHPPHVPPTLASFSERSRQAGPLCFKPPPLSLVSFRLRFLQDRHRPGEYAVGRGMVDRLPRGRSSLPPHLHPHPGVPPAPPRYAAPPRLKAVGAGTAGCSRSPWGLRPYARVELGTQGQRKGFQCLNRNSYMDFTPVAFRLLPRSRRQREDAALRFPPANPPLR